MKRRARPTVAAQPVSESSPSLRQSIGCVIVGRLHTTASPLYSLSPIDSMRTILTLAVVVLLCTNVSFGASTPAPDDESVLEHRFDAFIQPNDLRDWMKVLAAEPNQVGSPHDKANAEQILAWFKSWGWDAHIETFEVLYPTPISETLELVGPKPFKATLQEPPIPGDSSATATEPALPAYVEYQGDGDVTAELVYVNYGMQDDYKTLAAAGRQRQGQDRHRALRRRAGAGLSRSSRRITARSAASSIPIRPMTAIQLTRPIPSGPMRPPRGHPARLGRRHAALSGRSADAWRRRDQGRQAAEDLRSADRF